MSEEEIRAKLEEERELWGAFVETDAYHLLYRPLLQSIIERKLRHLAYTSEAEEILRLQEAIKFIEVLLVLPERIRMENEEPAKEKPDENTRKQFWEREPGVPLWAGRATR